MKILISAVGGPPSVSLIKHLQKKGHFVIGIDSEINAVGKFFCNKFYQSPFIKQRDEYIELLKNIDFDFFFPYLDEEHILFADVILPNNLYNKIITSPPETIKIVTDKINTYHFAIANQIPVPLKKTTTPCFVRKRFSRGSKYTYIEYEQNKLNTLNTDEYLIQEIIEGTEYTVDIIVCEKEFFAVPRKRLLAKNVSIIGEVDMNEDIINFCYKICQKLKFFGVINIQLMRSSINNEIYLIEINPRLAGTAILSIEAGFDIFEPIISYKLGLPYKMNFKIKDKLKMFRYWSEYYVDSN